MKKEKMNHSNLKDILTSRKKANVAFNELQTALKNGQTQIINNNPYTYYMKYLLNENISAYTSTISAGTLLYRAKTIHCKDYKEFAPPYRREKNNRIFHGFDEWNSRKPFLGVPGNGRRLCDLV